MHIETEKSKHRITTIVKPSIIIIIGCIILRSYNIPKAIFEVIYNSDGTRELSLISTCYLFLSAPIKILTIVTLFLKKKIGWILLMLMAFLVIAQSFFDFYIVFGTFTDPFLQDSYSIIESKRNMIACIVQLIIAFSIIIYMNKKELLSLFSINKEIQLTTLISSVIIMICKMILSYLTMGSLF